MTTDSVGSDRREMHNSCVDEHVAHAGGCGYVHLPSGRTCTLRDRHHGPCDFVARPGVENSVAERRAAGGW